MLIEALSDTDSAVRWWGAIGLLIRGEKGVVAARQELLDALKDNAPVVRIAGGEAVGRYGSAADAAKALDVLLALADAEKNGVYLALTATNAIDYMEERARPAAKAIAALPREDPNANSRFNKNVGRVIEKILSDLGEGQQTKGS